MLFIIPFILVSISIDTALPALPASNDVNEEITEEVVNTVYIDIVGTSMNNDVKRFLTEQLMPAIQKFGSHLVLRYHPYGAYYFTKCYVNTTDDITTSKCECQNGPVECTKNVLQACVMEVLPNTTDHMDIILCTQGSANYEESFRRCIKNNVKIENPKKIHQCATGEKSMELMVLHGYMSADFGYFIEWVPFLVINGEHKPEAVHRLQSVLCSEYFKPPPDSCSY